MFLANMFKNVVLRITPDGQQSIYAGTGVNQAGPFSGIATAVPLQQPSGLALAPDGSLFVVEYASTWMLGSPQLGHRIRKITPDGRITTVAGNGRTGDAADGLAAVNAPLLASSVAVAVDGRLFVADYDNHKIRLIDTNGIMRTIAGGGTVVDFDLPIDAKEASIPFPTNIAVTRDGTLYFATGGRVIELKPRPDSSYSAAAFFGGTPTGDCGTGALEGVAKSNDSLDAAVKASMAVMCQGLVRSVAVRDTCAASGGEVRIAIGQQFDHFMNIMEVTRACRAP
jgi:DNA-binding beta-propeller fold protein YncE